MWHFANGLVGCSKLCQIQPSASWPLRSCQFGNAGPLLPFFSCLWPRFWNRKIVGLHHLLRMKMTAIWFPSAIKQLHAVLREILPCCCILLRASTSCCVVSEF